MMVNAIRSYEDASSKDLQMALQTVLEKVVDRVVFTSTSIASDMYQEILLTSRFNNTVYQIIRHAAHDPITFPPDLRQVLMYVQTVDVPSFDMSHNDGFTESLGISGRISPILLDGRIPNHLKQLQLLTLRKVNGADFTNFTELTGFSLSCYSFRNIRLPINGALKTFTVNDQIYRL